MIVIKPYIDKFQIKHNFGKGYHIAYLVPSMGGYSIIVNDHNDYSRVSALPLLENGDSITINGTVMILKLKNGKVSNDTVSIVPLNEQDNVYLDQNNKTLERYRNGSFTKQKVHSKFVDSMKLTYDFRAFLNTQGVDITLISSQTLILIGVLFYEFIGSRTDITHQICMDPLTNEYDIALIVK